jgi:hypothetical protein
MRLCSAMARMREVDDVVAVEVTTDAGSTGFFMTWGRIQDPVDPGPLETLTLRALSGFRLLGRPLKARVCLSLQDAAGEPYFYEALLAFARESMPHGDGYEAWRMAKDSAMASGKGFFFLGEIKADTLSDT